jgi:ATP-dependent exoDNAse (exonuclease V) beta subunit
LNDPLLAPLFTRPPEQADVWRERPFEGVLDGMWITGVFDRVVVERDDAGENSKRITVVDFKSDRVEGPDEILRATERHAGQLGLYRRAAALLAGVSLARVDCQIVFTACHRAAPLPPCA